MEIIIIPVVFGVIATVIILISQGVAGVARRKFLHQERMAAIEKGVPLPEDILNDTLVEGRVRSNGANVALQGTIWTSLGIGILLSSQLVHSARLGEDFERFLLFLSVWAYPAISVGVGMLAYAWFNREKKS